MIIKKLAHAIAVCHLITLTTLVLAACGGDSDSGSSPDLAQTGLSSSAEAVEESSNSDIENDSTGILQTDTLNGQTETSSSSSSSSPVFSSDNSEPTSSESVSSRPYEGKGIDPATVEKSTVTDERDGQVYKTVKIGNQTWMAENLNFAYEVKDDSGNVVLGTYCSNNNVDSCYTMGRLYTWAAVMDSAGLYSEDSKGCGMNQNCEMQDTVQGVCFKGWHVSSLTEWEELFESVGGTSMAGLYLKSTSGWKGSNVYVVGGGGVSQGVSRNNGIDSYGFSVYPTVFWDKDYQVRYKGEYAHFWTPQIWSSSRSASLITISGEMSVSHSTDSRGRGETVRCVKD